MPTYQYACTEETCGHRFEAVQAFTDSALSVCPVCDGKLRKVFSPVGVVFKGSGFYRNDSRSSANGSSGASKSSSGSSTETGSKSGDSASSSSKDSGSKDSGSKDSGSSKSDSSSSASSSSAPAKAAAS